KEAPSGTVASVQIGSTTIASFEGANLDADAFKTQSGAFNKQLTDAVKSAGYPAKADPAAVNFPMLLLLLTILVVYVTMVYGPIAAWLVELFPTRIRYSSLSLPYHIGNGWFGGFLPSISFALVAFSGDIYYGLWYTVIISVMTLIIGTLFLPETKNVDISR
ncbi:MAG TPA: MFS transporter, partial [Rudaea sp.]|nr:MFS transporter [Rudaea sp.]